MKRHGEAGATRVRTTHPAPKPLDHNTGRGRSRTVPQALVSSASDTLDEEVMDHAVEPYRLDGPMMGAHMGDAARGSVEYPSAEDG
jgi:hypothetical protein